MWLRSRCSRTPGASRHSGSGAATAYSSSATWTGTGPVNSARRNLTGNPGADRTATPDSRRAENGASAGTATSTSAGPFSSRCRASGDPADGSRIGSPAGPTRNGTGIGGIPREPGQATVAAMARAIVVRATSARGGPGSTSKSMKSI